MAAAKIMATVLAAKVNGEEGIEKRK